MKSSATTPTADWKRKRGVPSSTAPQMSRLVNTSRGDSSDSDDTQPKRLKKGKNLDSSDIYPSRFTSRNSSERTDLKSLKGPDVLKVHEIASPSNKSIVSSQGSPGSPIRKGAPPRSQNSYAPASPMRSKANIITVDSDSEDDFEKLMSRIIKERKEAAAAKESRYHLDVTNSEVVAKAKVEAKGAVLKLGDPDSTTGGRPVPPQTHSNRSALEPSIATKYGKAKRMKDAQQLKVVESRPEQRDRTRVVAALSPEQYVEDLRAKLRVANEISRGMKSATQRVNNRINLAEKRVADWNKGVQEASKTDGKSAKQIANGDAREKVTQEEVVRRVIVERVPTPIYKDTAERKGGKMDGTIMTIAEENPVEYDEPLLPFITTQNPARESPAVAAVTQNDTRAFDAIRRAYAARTAVAADQASRRAASLSNSLGTELVCDTTAKLQSGEKGALRSLEKSREERKVTFNDELIEHVFREHNEDEQRTDLQGSRAEAFQPNGNGDGRSEPRKAANGGSTERSSKEYGTPAMPLAVGMGAPWSLEKGDGVRPTSDRLAQKAVEHAATKPHGDERKTIELPEMRDAPEEPKNAAAKRESIDQYPKENNVTGHALAEDWREPPKPLERRDVGGEQNGSPNDNPTEPPPEVKEMYERSMGESTECESISDDSVVEVPLQPPSITTLEEQRKRLTKNSSVKSRKYAVNTEMYWEYRVIRSTWRDEEDPPLQYHCGTYLDRDSANKAARDQLFPLGAASDDTLYDEYHKEKDAFDMDIYSAQSSRGHILIFTERLLRHKSQADAPGEEAKKTWMNPKVFVIWEKYTEYEELDEDDLFGENSNENRVKSSATTMLGIYTTRNIANKAASDHALERIKHDTFGNGQPTIRNEVEFIELQMQSRKHLEVLEEEQGVYNSEVEIGSKNELSVWVDVVDLVGPRN